MEPELREDFDIDHSHSNVASIARQPTEVIERDVTTLRGIDGCHLEGNTVLVLEESADDDDRTATPTILSKFDALASQWSVAPSHQSNDGNPPATPKLLHKLEDLHRTWSSGSPPKNERIFRSNRDRTPGSPSKDSVQSNESSLGRTTLSSHETSAIFTDGEPHLIRDERQAVFDRLYRNEKRYTPRVRQRNSPSPPDITRGTSSPTDHSVDSFCSASLEKRLSYRPPGEVRRVRQAARLRESASAPSPVQSTPTVYDRLYRKEPRTKNLIATPKPLRTTSHGSPTRSIQTDVRRRGPSIQARLPSSAGTVRSDTAAKRPTVSQSSQTHTPSGKNRDINLSHLSSQISETRPFGQPHQSVFDRLYRNEPRPTPRATNRSSQRLQSIASQNAVASSSTRMIKATIARPVKPVPSAPTEFPSVVASSSTQSRLQKTVTQRTRRRAIQPTATEFCAENPLKKSHSNLSVETNEIMEGKPKAAVTSVTNDPSPATAAETLSATSSFSHTSPTSATTTGVLTNYDNYPNADITSNDERLPNQHRTGPHRRTDSEDGSWSARQEMQSLEVPAVTTMQHRWNKSMINRRRNAAALTIQSVYRGYQCRLLWAQQKKENIYNLAATQIQSRWKGFSTRWQVAAERTRDEVLRNDVLCATRIQSLWRSYRTRLANGLTRKRMAAISIQTVWRSFIGRSMYLAGCRYRNAQVSTIQRFWRALLVRRWQHQRESASIVVQQFWKSYQLRSAAYLDWCNRRSSSATRIQAMWRSIVAVAFLRRRVVLVINIQRCWRGFAARNKLSKQVDAARQIASFALKKFRRLRHLQQLQIRCAMIIQSYWKSYRLRSAFLDWNGHRRKCAVRIQSMWRSSVAVKSLCRSKTAAIKIQSYLRRFHERTKWHRAKAASRRIVRVLQMTLARRRMRQLETRSATTIQALWRLYRCHSSYSVLFDRRQRSAVIIQSMWRSCVAAAMLRGTLAKTIQIQSVWRGFLARLKRRQSFIASRRIGVFLRKVFLRLRLREFQTRSAIFVQKFWRAYRCRSFYSKLRDSRQNSAIRIQSMMRSFVASSVFRRNVKNAIKIQQRWRGFYAKSMLYKSNDAAIRIALFFRTSLARLRRQELQNQSASTIQRHWKSYQLRSAFMAWCDYRRTSVIRIQSVWRSLIASAELRQSIAGATKIQCCWRRFYSNTMFWKSRDASRRIAMFLRKSLARLRLNNLRNRSATTIQMYWVSYRLRSTFLTWRDYRLASAIRIQSLYRALIAASILSRCKGSAVKIQRYWRGSVIRAKVFTFKQLQAKHATLIQAYWNSYRLRVSFLELCEERQRSAIRIQSKWKSMVAVADLKKSQLCVTMIQKHWRGFNVRKKLLRSIVAASRIALFFRKCLARQRLTEIRARSATALQAQWKSHRFRATVLELFSVRRMSAIRIQARWRSLKAITTYHRSRRKACMIQCYWRRFNAMSNFHQLIELRDRSANFIMYFWRSRRLRSAFLAWFHHRSSSATFIQSTWRSLRMLFKIEAALYLLRRSVFGKCSRKTALYPLLVINLIFRSLKSVRFLSWKQFSLWKFRMVEAMDLAAVLIQCFARGYLCRKQRGSFENQKRFFCMLPFKRHCHWTSTLAHPLIDEKPDATALLKSPMESRVADVLVEQAELFSSFAASYLIIVGADTPLMGSVSEFFGTPCLQRLAKSVRLSASSFVSTFSLTDAMDFSHNFDLGSQGKSGNIQNIDYVDLTGNV